MLKESVNKGFVYFFTIIVIALFVAIALPGLAFLGSFVYYLIF